MWVQRYFHLEAYFQGVRAQRILTIHFSYNLWELRAQVREFEPSLPVPKTMFLNSFGIKSNRNIPQVSALEYGLIPNASISSQHEKLKHWYLPWPGSLMLSYNCLTAWLMGCHCLVSPQGTGYMAWVPRSHLCRDRPPAKAIQERWGPARRDGPQPPQGAVSCWQVQLNARRDTLIERFSLHFNFLSEKNLQKHIFHQKFTFHWKTNQPAPKDNFSKAWIFQ